VAVELTPEAARQLAQTILATLEQAEASGHLEVTVAHAETSG
jgi:hypothetical protein